MSGLECPLIFFEIYCFLLTFFIGFFLFIYSDLSKLKRDDNKYVTIIKTGMD